MKKIDKSSFSNLSLIIKNSPLDQNFLGNPVFYPGYKVYYLQENARPLKFLLKQYSLEESKLFLRRYTYLIKYLWGFGIHEKKLDFTVNIGVDKENRVMLNDLSYLSFDKDQALRDVENKVWESGSAYCSLAGSPLQEFYYDLMDDEITISCLEDTWRVLN
jgi:hypothetical protein